MKIRKDKRTFPRSTWTLILLAVLLLLLFLGSFAPGRYEVPLGQVVKILADGVLRGLHLGGLPRTWDDAMAAAVLHIRAPRILLGCLVGGCLSLAGTAYQSVFRNPLAAPDLLGASSGACFGAALGILLRCGTRGITAMAFGCSLVTVLAVYAVGSRVRGNRVTGILLAGIMVSSLFSAGTSYLKLVADPADQLPAITYWLMGSLSGTRMSDIRFVLLPMALGAVPLYFLRWRINLLTVGDESARAMGVRTDTLRWVVILCATLLTASSVAVSGMIGWVGLIVPHLSRRLVGNDCRKLLPCCLLLGAVFLLLVDDLARNLLPVEIPLGILTAFVGAPFFLWLMLRKEDAV